MSRTRLAVQDPSDVSVPGTFGSVSLYRRPSPGRGEWALETTLRVEGGFPGWLGNSGVALNEDTLVVGAVGDTELGGDAGAAYVFQQALLDSDAWHLTQKLLAPDGGRVDTFGNEVAIDGEWLFVGAMFHSFFGRRRGAVYVYRRTDNEAAPWAFFQELEPESLHFGSAFGSSITLSGNSAVVGAPKSNLGTLGGGALYTFDWNGLEWVESGYLAPPGLDSNDDFGIGLARSGDWLFAGAEEDDDLASNAGAVYVFRRVEGQWVLHQKLLAEGGKSGEGFGVSLAAETNHLYVGSPFVSEKGPSAGTVYTFEFEPITQQWLQVARYFPPDLDQKDFLGGSVAVEDGVVAAGAVKSLEPGAVYLFSARPGRGVSTYCTASSGSVPDCAPALETLGAPSASQGSTFRVWSQTVPGAQNGVVLYTGAGPARPDLAASGACLPSTNPKRKGLFWSGGTFGQCDGTFLLDWNEFVDDRDPDASLLRTPGAVVHLQIAWFDPLVPGPLAWSDALAFQLCP